MANEIKCWTSNQHKNNNKRTHSRRKKKLIELHTELLVWCVFAFMTKTSAIFYWIFKSRIVGERKKYHRKFIRRKKSIQSHSRRNSFHVSGHSIKKYLHFTGHDKWKGEWKTRYSKDAFRWISKISQLMTLR